MIVHYIKNLFSMNAVPYLSSDSNNLKGPWIESEIVLVLNFEEGYSRQKHHCSESYYEDNLCVTVNL